MGNKISLRSGKDLLCLAEVFRAEKADGPYIFAFTKFAYIDAEYVAYYGEATVRKKQLTLQQREDLLWPILDEEIYPAVSPLTTVAPHPHLESYYIKPPKLSSYNDLRGTNTTARLLLQEAEIMEILRKNPHPNIVKYHGCVTRRNRIVGIVFDRLCKTIDARLELEAQRNQHGTTFDTELCFQQVKAAVEHLHILGLAHNDICPANIMVDAEDNALLIDYGSCQPLGDRLISAGTPGWMQEYFTTSELKHDEFSLKKLEEWLVKYRQALHP